MSVEYPKLSDNIKISIIKYEIPEQAYLIQVPNGKSIKVSKFIYHILSLMNGKRSVDEIANEISKLQERDVNSIEIKLLIDRILIPLNLIEFKDKTLSSSFRKGHFSYISLDILNKCSDILHHIFNTYFMIIILPLIILTNFMVYYMSFLSIQNIYMMLETKELLFSFFLLILTIFFHEIGHLSACHHFGCIYGGITVKKSLFFPKIYADISDSLRLTNKEQLIVNLGGIWMQAIFIPILFFIYLFSKSLMLVFIIFLINLGMIWIMLPIPHNDGYWILTNILNIPIISKKNLSLLFSINPHSKKIIHFILLILIILGATTLYISVQFITIWKLNYLILIDKIISILSQGYKTSIFMNLLNEVTKFLITNILSIGLFILNFRLIKCIVTIFNGIY